MHCTFLPGLTVDRDDDARRQLERLPEIMPHLDRVDQLDSRRSRWTACIIAAAQKSEHYEIGSYGTMIAWAKALELTEVASLLNEILEEEKAADAKLSVLAESGINEAATAGESDEEDDETVSREKESV